MLDERTPPHRHHTRHPWHTVLRRTLQGVVALAAAAPLIYTAITCNNPEAAVGGAAVALAVARALTRLMAVPAVDRLLRDTLPWLAQNEPVHADWHDTDWQRDDTPEPPGGEVPDSEVPGSESAGSAATDGHAGPDAITGVATDAGTGGGATGDPS